MTCNNCNQVPCSCGVNPLTPLPFYAGAPSCQQSHQQNVFVNQFAFGLQVQSSWNVPLCGESAVLHVPGLTIFPVGAYIWNSVYGYYLATAFDALNGLLTVQNQCNSGNASPGTTVPSCTTFVVAPVPCCDQSSGQSGVCVKYDFTAPEVDTCVDITVTSVDGLIVGNDVQIGSGVYRLQAVKANNVITICNDGAGITPGTPVIAQNAFGQYQYCLTIISVSPCVQTPVTTGQVIVCHGGSEAPLSGNVEPMILVLTDHTTNTAQYQDIPDTIQPILCAMNHNSCCADQNFGDVPLQFITQNVNFGMNEYWKYDFPTPLRSVTFTDSCNHGILSQVTVAILVDFISGGSTPTPILGEIDLFWNNDPGPYTYSKMVWQDLFDDGWDITNTPPGVAPMVQTQLASGAPRYPMMYHAQQIESFTILNGNGTVTLGGFVSLTLGENFTPANVYGVSLMFSGWLKIFRT